jgi:hypothetical protein
MRVKVRPVRKLNNSNFSALYLERRNMKVANYLLIEFYQ